MLTSGSKLRLHKRSATTLYMFCDGYTNKLKVLTQKPIPGFQIVGISQRDVGRKNTPRFHAKSWEERQKKI